MVSRGRRLPFERKYLLDGENCPRCNGTGLATRPSRNQTPECWSCRGLGRKLTREARDVFAAICMLMGKPVTEGASRIEPRHLDTISAEQLRMGMRVSNSHPDKRRKLTEILSVSRAGVLESLRVVYVDGAVEIVSPLEVFTRELTPQEIAEIELLMEDYVGLGATGAGEDAKQPT